MPSFVRCKPRVVLLKSMRAIIHGCYIVVVSMNLQSFKFYVVMDMNCLVGTCIVLWVHVLSCGYMYCLVGTCIVLTYCSSFLAYHKTLNTCTSVFVLLYKVYLIVQSRPLMWHSIIVPF